VAVAVLVDNKYSHKIYELTGSELMSFESATSQIASALKRPISYSEISIDDYLGMLKSYQLPDDYIWLIQYLFTEVLDGRNESLSNDIETILGRKPATFQEYVSKTVKTRVWEAQ
jgi:uncharacterized protein YbjT (DUF2867 family)